MERSFGYWNSRPTDDARGRRHRREMRMGRRRHRGSKILPRREMVGAMKPLTWTAGPLATRETAATAERERYKAENVSNHEVPSPGGGPLGEPRGRAGDGQIAYRGPGQLAEHFEMAGVAQLGTPDTGIGGLTEGFGEKS